jgi:imidazolonepropionase-like amidohydrolase
MCGCGTSSGNVEGDLKKTLAGIAAVLLAALPGCQQIAPTPSASTGTAIVDVTVIDMTGAAAKPHMTVLVEGDRIVRIEPAEGITLGPGVRQVDGKGRYLIPGMWDMHAHVAEYAPIWFPVMLANGITGVRNMHAQSLDLTTKLKADLRSGALVGPRLVANGPLVDGPGGPWPSSAFVRTPEEAVATVDNLADKGADFIKVYSFLSRESYFAIAAEAKRRAIPFVGHVPQVISAREATTAGQHSIEHLDGVLLASSGIEEELRARFIAAGAAWRTPATAADGQTQMMAVNSDLVATYDERKADALFGSFAANGTMQAPTLVTHYTNAHRDEADIAQNPEFRFIPASMRAQWAKLPPPDPAWLANARLVLTKYREVVAAMRKAGVVILAGTDTGGALLAPGDSLHRELRLLVSAGLTPMQALQSATRNPALYFGELKSTGTIEVGKTADLVLLDADPLADIGNTRRIRAVMGGGVLHVREDLDRMLAKAEADAAQR